MQWKTNRKLHVAGLMAPLPMTLSDLEGHFYSLNLSNSHTLGKILCKLSMICLHINWKVHVACNFNLFSQLKYF